jgi:hypothetical protein
MEAPAATAAAASHMTTAHMTAATTAAHMTTATTAATTAAAGHSYLLTRFGPFLVEDIKRCQADIEDFLLTEKDSVGLTL